MRLESYAQDFEDIFLFAMLSNVKNGFYIDVGANDPTDLSVTRFFYERGWNGINVEPLKSKCQLLDEVRPRDINLCIGLGAEHGEMFIYGDSVMSTFSDDVAKKSFGNIVNQDGVRVSPEKLKSKIPTPIFTLTEIFSQYCSSPPVNQIHFCKIDVEGFEREVLLGVKNWNEFRPWIFVIESTFPGTSEPYFEQWESILLDAGYFLAFAHGINRYYVDSRRAHIAKTFDEVLKFLRPFEIRKMNATPIRIV